MDKLLSPNRRPWYLRSTPLIFIGLLLGIILGGFFPSDQYPWAYQFFKFLSKAFISLIKSLIIPLLVSTIIIGIAQTGDIKAVGRMGGKALIYFEIVTTIALFIGLGVANWIQPGKNLPLDLSGHSAVVLSQAKSGWDILLHAFPSNFYKHAVEGDILPVVIFAVLFGIALTRVGEKGKSITAFFDSVAQVMFKYTDMVMTLTPLGVFGAMAYNVSHMAAGHQVGGVFLQGWPAVGHLLKQYSVLVGSLYFALFILFILVFVPIMWICKVKVFSFLKAISDPVITAFSTASSESALPKLLESMVRFGVPRRVASFVIPTGYSFNLDGSTLYLVLASLTIAQAAHAADPVTFPAMSLGTQFMMVFAFMLTSKGVAGVPRATLVIIAATIASFHLPGEAGIAMLLAVDEIMDMARTAINVMGNGLATVVIAKWEGVLGQPETSDNI
ncbi:MAG: dicarboxylate/amino acid:cation symporter [Holophagaceae bacterium]|jgi:proton glutamate symport protein